MMKSTWRQLEIELLQDDVTRLEDLPSSRLLTRYLQESPQRPNAKSCAAPSPFRFSTTKPLSHRVFSICLETMQPFHTTTASALMMSMLTVSRTGYHWLPQGIVNSSAIYF
ncbi:hypothetical protein Hanom_Chr01g00016071 [Helianthus anomalus]